MASGAQYGRYSQKAYRRRFFLASPIWGTRDDVVQQLAADEHKGERRIDDALPVVHGLDLNGRKASACWKRHISDQPEPETRFDLPATGPRSAKFGVKRVLNGEPRSPHAGLDVAVGVGAPLRAPAPGTVLAVDDLYFTGKTVVIDHGQGVLTLYAHLSRVDAAEGQRLRRGEVFGTSGVSGRITGPHLHWVVILGGTAVDPELFLKADR